MNVQIFGKSKCFDTKKAERYFKERRIPYQLIDVTRFGMSPREFESVLRAVGGVDRLIDWDSKDQTVTNLRYMDDPATRQEKLFENWKLLKTPVVRERKAGHRGLLPGSLGAVEMKMETKAAERRKPSAAFSRFFGKFRFSLAFSRAKCYSKGDMPPERGVGCSS